MKKAIITGINGQDGPFLAKLLLDKGYEVYGADRRRALKSNHGLKYLGINEKVKQIEFELTEFSNIWETINKIQPDEFYNLAAQSFVKTSFGQPLLTSEVNALGPLKILNAIHKLSPSTKYYQASTSEMFGLVQEIPQNEKTAFYPRSPYGVSKLFAHWITKNYRESYNLYACSGILFNHESELRGTDFVTKKITSTVARISKGSKETLELGNLDAKRDWGHAKDYVKGMYLMLQQEFADDYVLSTGQTISVREFVEKAFQKVGIKISWQGNGINEFGIDSKGRKLVSVNPDFFRPSEVDVLIGDYNKAKLKLGWEPEISIDELVDIMINYDIININQV